MAIGIRVGNDTFEIGTPSFLKSFFSTIFVRLEAEDWGSRFPLLMTEFYLGTLSYAHADAAIRELSKVRSGLEARPPSDVVWDFEDRVARAPWGDERAEDITNLSEEFVTSDGKNLIDVISAAFELAKEKGRDAVII